VASSTRNDVVLKLVPSDIPLLFEEGWMRDQEKIAKHP
jgi:hypothetical protein